jgi:alternate signal-mediated exported protein
MNKTTKGAFAASAAAVLLLGGAGSLAYWTDAATVDGGSISSGTLNITGVGCDADWTYAGTTAKTGIVKLFVPGDVVTKKCTFTVAATGDNLSAKVSAQKTLNVTPSRAGSLQINTAATYAQTGVKVPRPNANDELVTTADNAGTLTATFVATIPFGSNETTTPQVNANDTKSITAALDKLTVSLTQVNPNA